MEEGKMEKIERKGEKRKGWKGNEREEIYNI